MARDGDWFSATSEKVDEHHESKFAQLRCQSWEVFVSRINSKINAQVSVGRLFLQSELGEVSILFSPDDELLDPSEVEGLKV